MPPRVPALRHLLLADVVAVPAEWHVHGHAGQAGPVRGADGVQEGGEHDPRVHIGEAELVVGVEERGGFLVEGLGDAEEGEAGGGLVGVVGEGLVAGGAGVVGRGGLGPEV